VIHDVSGEKMFYSKLKMKCAGPILILLCFLGCATQSNSIHNEAGKFKTEADFIVIGKCIHFNDSLSTVSIPPSTDHKLTFGHFEITQVLFGEISKYEKEDGVSAFIAQEISDKENHLSKGDEYILFVNKSDEGETLFCFQSLFLHREEK